MGLAKYLQGLGHEVVVYAASPLEATLKYGLLYDDDHICAAKYVWEGIEVVGIHSKFSTREEIYSKQRPELISSLVSLMQKAGSEAQLLHIHANTLLNGTNFIEAQKRISPKVKVLTSYHLPLNCVKNDLLFAGKIEACQVKVSPGICSACTLASNLKFPLSVSKSAIRLFPKKYFASLPTSVNIRYLVGAFLDNFFQLCTLTDHWLVYSDEIKRILEINDISPAKISMIRHGCAPAFSNLASDRSKTVPYQFCFASRPAASKGFFTLLSAWLAIQTPEKFHLTISGNIPAKLSAYESRLIAHAKLKDNITWLAPQSQADLAKLFGSVHAVVIPSETVETGPLVFHEAIAAGADVIASNLGGCAELANYYAEKSSLFKAGDTTSLKLAIERFVYSGRTLAVPTVESHVRQVEQIYSNFPC